MTKCLNIQYYINEQVGSIGAGGRYDRLVESFSGVNVPVVGASVGIERIFAILEEKERAKGPIRSTQTEVIYYYN